MLSKLLDLCEEIKNTPKYVLAHWHSLALMQVYSPIFLKVMGKKILKGQLDEIELSLLPSEIQALAKESVKMDDNKLQSQINKFWIKKAVYVLSQYQNCAIPLSDSHQGLLNGKGENLLSKKGEKILGILNQALQKGEVTGKVAKLALKAAHKFYIDLDLYKEWDISAKSLLYPLIDAETQKLMGHNYPTIQLTKGCLNQCSHCLMRAVPPLTHMPYPMFLSLHNRLWKTYKKFKSVSGDEIGVNEDLRFGKFFFDSDSLSYHDDIMGVDTGDIVLRSFYNKIPVSVMTRGVNTLVSKRALYKMINKVALPISFVDTPLENKEKSLKQLNDTLDLLEKYGVKKELIRIFHLHPNTGPEMDKKIFRDYLVEDVNIYRAGRAKNLSAIDEPIVGDQTFIPQIVIEPTGDIQMVYFKDLEAVYKNMGSLLQKRYLSRGSFFDWYKKLKQERQKEC